MNIYKNITTAGLTLFGCAAEAHSKLSNLLLPTQFMNGCQYNDLLIGLICSKVDYCAPPIGDARDLFDTQLYCMSKIGTLEHIKKIPVFSRQNEILSELEINNVTMGRNEELIRAAFSGTPKPALDNIFDVINIQHTFDTFCSIESYDLNKIGSDIIYYRAGYIDEYCDINGAKFSLRQVPVLGTQKQAFGSQFFNFNSARVDCNSKEILTVMFGFGLTAEHFDTFANNLILLKDVQEKHASTTTVKMQILSGYPAAYDFNGIQTPCMMLDL